MKYETKSNMNQANFVLMGPPGSGKGTFSYFMTMQNGYYQICLGDILRIHKKNETALGKEILEKGGFVDDNLACKIIVEEVSRCIEKKIPFIIDGFPRNTNSFDFMTKLFESLGISSTINFIYFVIDDQTCINRINKRLVCFKCSNIYNTTTKKPQIDMTCDICNTTLEIREGDSFENTTKRLKAFREGTEPLIELAKKQFKIISIDAIAPESDCINIYKSLIKK